MNLFIYDNSTNEVRIDQADVLLLREFSALWSNDRNITKTDKRFVYVASKETKDMKDYIDAIFKQLESNDTSKIKFAIKELKNFEKNYFKAYFLDSDQLNTLSNILDKSMQVDDLKDPEFRCDLLGIILNEITMNRTEPTNKKAFLETLKSLLDNCPSQDYFAKPYNPIPFIIKILGIYRDKAVIERLKQDTKTLPPQVLNDTIVCYNTKFTAKVIEQNKIDLFNLGTELQNSNKKEAIAFLDQIRNQAINDLTMLKGFGDIEEYLYR